MSYLQQLMAPQQSQSAQQGGGQMPVSNALGGAQNTSQMMNPNFQQQGNAQGQMYGGSPNMAAMPQGGGQPQQMPQFTQGAQSPGAMMFGGPNMSASAPGTSFGGSPSQANQGGQMSPGVLSALMGGFQQQAPVSMSGAAPTSGQFGNGFQQQQIAAVNPMTSAPATGGQSPAAPATRTAPVVARQPAPAAPAAPQVTPGRVSTPAGPANIVNPTTGTPNGVPLGTGNGGTPALNAGQVAAGVTQAKNGLTGDYLTDPSNSAYQFAYDPGKGYSISDPTKGQSSFNVNGTGWSPTLQAAENTFSKAFGNSGGAMGAISPQLLAALTGQGAAPAAAPAAKAPIAATAPKASVAAKAAPAAPVKKTAVTARRAL